VEICLRERFTPAAQLYCSLQQARTLHGVSMDAHFATTQSSPTAASIAVLLSVHRGCVPVIKCFPHILTSPPSGPRRSLWSNDISSQAKEAVSDAAGNGISIEF